MIEKDNILFVLKNAKEAIEKKDPVLLREMSNRTIHSASIYKDPDAVMVAVTTYALSKILERENYRNYPEWEPFVELCSKFLENAISSLEKNNLKAFRKNMIKIRKQTEKITSKLKDYISEVFKKAAINKASRIYEHGISRAETAELLGITQWELAEYVGITGIPDVNLGITKSIKDRINLARDLFR
ncbi:MAG: hypothetical protein NZ889_01280 [Candidatus Pacearchaeota archaeon]|nr:hypothetical protein [Candidatus Pacearchaeota archaeon]